MHQEKSTATRLTACVAGVLLAAGSASAQPATTPASFDEAGRPLQITEIFSFDPVLALTKPVSPVETSPENQELITQVTWAEVTNTSDSEFILSDTRIASILDITVSLVSDEESSVTDAESSGVQVPTTIFSPGGSVIFCLTPADVPDGTNGIGSIEINEFDSSEIENLFNSY
ncbi:MAG: hypothetical protein AAF108_01230 [Planctomycetota bacterium]